jgi:hypothetical protein
VSSPMKYLDLLLKIPPDEVMLDFLAQCGLVLRDVDADDAACATLHIAIEIERAPLSVRDGILAGLRQVALLADMAGLNALRTSAVEAPVGIHPLHLPEAPAQCALWVYLRHREIFDAACRRRGLSTNLVEPMRLDHLRLPLRLPDDPSVAKARLCEVTLLDEVSGGELVVLAPVDDMDGGVLQLLSEWMPNDNPARQERFQVIAAKIDLTFLPEFGQAIGRSATLVLKRRGGSNLADFDAGLRTRLESWLARWRPAA